MAISQNTWQFIVYLALLVLTVGVTYGAMTVKVSALEDCAKISRSDHDIVLVVQSKLDGIIEDLKEIKSDIKDLKRR